MSSSSSTLESVICLIAAPHKPFDVNVLKKCGNVILISREQLNAALAGTQPLFDINQYKSNETNVILLADEKLSTSHEAADMEVLSLIHATTDLLQKNNLLNKSELICSWDFNNGFSGENITSAKHMISEINNSPHNLQALTPKNDSIKNEAHPVKLVLLGSGGGECTKKLDPEKYENLSADEARKKYNSYMKGKQLSTSMQLVTFCNPLRVSTPSSKSRPQVQRVSITSPSIGASASPSASPNSTKSLSSSTDSSPQSSLRSPDSLSFPSPTSSQQHSNTPSESPKDNPEILKLSKLSLHQEGPEKSETDDNQESTLKFKK